MNKKQEFQLKNAIANIELEGIKVSPEIRQAMRDVITSKLTYEEALKKLYDRA